MRAQEGDRVLPSFLRALHRLVEAATLAFALVCCVAAVAAQGGRWSHRLDLLTHFAPLWLAGGLTCLEIAIVVSRGWRRTAAAGLALAAILSAGALMWMDLSRIPSMFRAAPAGRRLKLIEYNAWGRNSDPSRVAEWLAAEDPDIVVIIEATREMEDQIAAKTNLHVFEGSGAVIFTREKPLALNTAWGARAIPGADTEFTWIDLPDPDGTRFTVVGLHCGWPIPARRAWGQDRKIANFLATQDRSTLIMAGDFNSTQWSFRQREADASFGLERRDLANSTWPARLSVAHGLPFPLPFLAIDHIYAGAAWKTVRVVRGPRLGSDHYPLVATLVWAPPT